MFYRTLRKRKLSHSGRLLKNSGHVRAIAQNTGLCPVRPAPKAFEAVRGLSGLQTHRAHRLEDWKSMFRIVRYFNSLLGRDASANAADKGAGWNGARITIV